MKDVGVFRAQDLFLVRRDEQGHQKRSTRKEAASPRNQFFIKNVAKSSRKNAEAPKCSQNQAKQKAAKKSLNEAAQEGEKFRADFPPPKI